MSISSPVLTFSRIGPLEQHARRYGPHSFKQFFPARDQFDGRRVRGHADGQPGTGRRVDEIGSDAEIRIVIRNLIEDHQRRGFFEGEYFGQRADFEIPVGAVNFFDLARVRARHR